jgi:hypothetical protein
MVDALPVRVHDRVYAAAVPSRIYFPVQANAHSLVAGGPARSVRRRLILAALMHDQVLVDEGTWQGWSGPSGSQELRSMPGGIEGMAEDFQTAAARGRATGANFYAAAKLQGSPGPSRVVLQSEATIAWKATFEPFRRELPRAYPWLEFINADLWPDDKRIVSAMVRRDTADGILSDLVPNQFSRKFVINNADFALVLGSRLGAATSMDPMHQNVVRARMARGEATPVYGAGALTILFPSVEDMTWDDVDAARKLPGLPDLRALLAEIEEAAWSEADSGRELDEAIRLDYQRRFHEAVDRLVPQVKPTVASILVDVGIGIVTGQLSGVVGVIKSAGTAGAARVKYERSWLTAAERLTSKKRT